MADLPTTRQSLLFELGKRNDAAWSEFLQVYEAAIVGYCLRRGLQHDDARDAAQEVFAALHGRLPTWERDSHRGSLRAWLFRVARNVCVDRIKAMRGQESAIGGTHANQLLSEVPGRIIGNAPIDSESDEELSELAIEWRRAKFEWAVEQVRREVRDATWQAFRLSAIEQQKAEQVAVELGISIGSVYTAKCRVMARIREKIKRLDDASHTTDSQA